MTRPSGADPLLVLADDLRDLGTRLAGAADELRRRATALPPTTTAAPAAPPAAPVPPTPQVPPMPPMPQVPQVPQVPLPAWGPPPGQVHVPPPPPGWAPPGWPVPPLPHRPPPMAGMPMAGVPMQPPPAPPAPPQDRGPAGWDRLGGRSLAWIGAAITLLGAVLLLVLAIQRGWLGPIPRLTVGGAFALALGAAAWWVHRKPDGRTGAFALAGTGIATAYLDIVAATALYHYLPPAVGLLLGLGIALGGLLVADRWQGQPLAVFVVLGAAVCAPLCTRAADALLVGFLIVLAGAAAPVQLRRGWPVLTLSAGLPALLGALALDATPATSPGTTSWAAAWAALIAAVVTLTLATLTSARNQHDATALVLLVTAPIPLLAAAPQLPAAPGAALLAVLALLLAATWASPRLPRVPALPGTHRAVAGAAAATVLVEATVLALHPTAAPTVAAGLAAEAIVLGALAHRLHRRGLLLTATTYLGLAWLTALGRPLSPRLLLAAPHNPLDTAQLVSGTLTGALLTTAATLIALQVTRLGPNLRPWAWTLTGITALYGSSGLLLSAALLAAPDRAGFLTGHVLITISWAGTALALLARGLTRQPLRVTGLVLVAAALAKLLLFDLATLDGILRVAAFLGAGLALLIAGVRYARLVATHNPDHTPAHTPGQAPD